MPLAPTPPGPRPHPEAIAAGFEKEPVADILQTLTAFDHARPTPDGRFAA